MSARAADIASSPSIPPTIHRAKIAQPRVRMEDGDRGGLARMQGIHGRERENRKSKQKKRKTHLTHTGIFIGFMNKLWRRGWDSKLHAKNPSKTWLLLDKAFLCSTRYGLIRACTTLRYPL